MQQLPTLTWGQRKSSLPGVQQPGLGESQLQFVVDENLLMAGPAPDLGCRGMSATSGVSRSPLSGILSLVLVLYPFL